jgi:tellurite resistance protein TerC
VTGPWIGFVALSVTLIAADLYLSSHRRRGTPTVGGALAATAVYVLLALAFNVVVYFLYERDFLDAGAFSALSGREAALQYLTAWLLEKSLSLDNIFVIALIFSYFRVPLEHQHRVLFWGILGAVVMRGVMIALGAYFFHRFEWMIYVFGGVLLLTAVKMLVARHDNLHPDNTPLVKLARRFLPITKSQHGGRFFVLRGGKWAMTPLFLSLLVVESTDLLFAFDSIPAAFAVTSDPFLIFTSNVFAILGLRSLYFVLAGLLDRFRYLKMSLVFVLAFVGVKILLSHTSPIPNLVSLAVIAGILGVGVMASIVGIDRDTARLRSPIRAELAEIGHVTIVQFRRIVLAVLGSTLLLLGLAMLIGPGPGIPLIVLALTVLGAEFAWARRWHAKVKRALEKGEALVQRVEDTVGRGAGAEPEHRGYP